MHHFNVLRRHLLLPSSKGYLPSRDLRTEAEALPPSSLQKQRHGSYAFVLRAPYIIMRRRLTSSTTVAMMAHFLLFWSLSLLRYHSVLSFTSPTGIHQHVSDVTRRRIPSRHVWFHVTSNDNVDAGGAPFEGDEDDEDQEDYVGKYPAESKKQDDDEDDDDDSETTAATWTALDETQRLIQQQQKQIDKLMELVQHQPQQSPPPPQTSSQPLQQDAAHQFNQFSEIPPATVLPQASSSSDTTTSDTAAVGAAAAVAPLKAMLFIDGTWLYYSIHERSEFKCPIVKAYGRGWQTRYQFDWTALIQVIAQQLQEQHLWNSRQTVEITRASVYTSCKKDTSIYSNRIKMFEEMKRNNYDVFMMETVGPGEKCVDIQLAVEMLHYATVANAYDVAILLSGDKDFLPALLRTRQKGRKVAIVAMRAGCNRALYETPNVKDYDVIWIDDYLDQLIVPRTNTPDKSPISTFTISKVIYDFIKQSGLPRVSSRDIGRYLKQIEVGGTSLLEELKQFYGGLFQFLTVSGCFDVARQSEQEERLARLLDPSDRTFWAELHGGAEQMLLEEAKSSHFTPVEKEFFDDYSISDLIDDDESYYFSRQKLGLLDGDDEEESYSIEPFVIPSDLKRDLTTCKVAELKEECRERGLPVSGTKAVLIERIQADMEEQISELRRQHTEKTKIKRPQMSGRLRIEKPPPPLIRPVPPEAEQYLEGLVKEYIQARGGKASSRDIGRYLAANAGSAGPIENSRMKKQTALSELKHLYGGLNIFLLHREGSFEKFSDDSPERTDYEYLVGLRE